MKRKILIIAGEVSGDQHAADLVRELKKLDGEIEFAGIGGDRLAGRGCNSCITSRSWRCWDSVRL